MHDHGVTSHVHCSPFTPRLTLCAARAHAFHLTARSLYMYYVSANFFLISSKFCAFSRAPHSTFGKTFEKVWAGPNDPIIMVVSSASVPQGGSRGETLAAGGLRSERHRSVKREYYSIKQSWCNCRSRLSNYVTSERCGCQ